MKRGSLKRWAALLKGELLTVYFAARDPEAPWLARFVAIAVAAYALSPIDLIPDFIPVLGLLDDILLVPLGFWLVLRLMPPPVIARARQRAAAQRDRLPRNLKVAAAIVVAWVLVLALIVVWLVGRGGGGAAGGSV
ncbi:YkvA family protein [Mitsuaria sp. GD03876]|uniref:YkvA family protein n=1 Tax=Mitsuaria sp. GD03876 TaxID=2975399 RepID=UPI0024485528|nr:YkvA family protein [Mitsuaria sp. GD03876]MDH0865583.1 YkvA family protein [Mitsuaria sp. GD03876]